MTPADARLLLASEATPRFGSRGLALPLYGMKNILVADVSKINRSFAQRLQKLCLRSGALSAIEKVSVCFRQGNSSAIPARDCIWFLSQEAMFSEAQQSQVAKSTLEQV
jgi:hypothetical protein